MGRKIVAIVLGIGAFLIVILGGILFYASHSLKHNIEVHLNSYFTALAKDTHLVEFEPFTCSGLRNFSCVSDNFSIINLLTFEKLTFGIYELSKPNSLRLSLESSSFSFANTKNVQDIHNLMNIFISGIAPQSGFSTFVTPTAFYCNMQNTLKDQIIQNLTVCNFNALNMDYTLTIDTAQNPNIAANSLKEVLFKSYQLYLSNQNEFKSKFLTTFNAASLSLSPKQLKSAIIDEAKSKNPSFNEGSYKSAIEMSKNLALYTFGLAQKHSKIPYYSEILASFDYISKMLNEDIKGIRYDLSPKKPHSFISLATLESSPLFNAKSFALTSKAINE